VISDEFEAYVERARRGEQLQFDLHVADAALLIRAVAATRQGDVGISLPQKIFWFLKLLGPLARMSFRSRDLVFLHALCTVVPRPVRLEIAGHGTSAILYLGTEQPQPPIEKKWGQA